MYEWGTLLHYEVMSRPDEIGKDISLGKQKGPPVK